MAKPSDSPRSEFDAASRRAYERRVLHLIQGYGPIQDARFREEHDGSSADTVFLRTEMDDQHPETNVTIHTFDRTQIAELESRHRIWDPELAGSGFKAFKSMRPPESVADEILTGARGPELSDLTAASASDTEWREKYAAVERRAFELHVLQLTQETSPILDASNGDYSITFLRAELLDEYPKTYLRVYTYERARDLERRGGHPIWHPYFASGDVADVEYMHLPERMVSEIMLWERGG